LMDAADSDVVKLAVGSTCRSCSEQKSPLVIERRRGFRTRGTTDDRYATGVTKKEVECPTEDQQGLFSIRIRIYVL